MLQNFKSERRESGLLGYSSEKEPPQRWHINSGCWTAMPPESARFEALLAGFSSQAGEAVILKDLTQCREILLNIVGSLEFKFVLVSGVHEFQYARCNWQLGFEGIYYSVWLAERQSMRGWGGSEQKRSRWQLSAFSRASVGWKCAFISSCTTAHLMKALLYRDQDGRGWSTASPPPCPPTLH